jgi:hypothetical protein
LSRFEAVNIGVLLFCPDSGFLKSMTSGNNARVVKFFGREGHDWKRLRAFKQGIEDRLQSERATIRTRDDLQQFIAMRANLIQISDPKPIKVFDAEQDLANLFQKLVGGIQRLESQRNLRKVLADTFAGADLSKKLLSNVRIDVPVLNRKVEMPFGYQNGRFNVINPVSFRSADPDSAFRTACKYAVEGRSIYEHPNGDYGAMQLVIVGQFRPRDNGSLALVRRVLSEHPVKLVKLDEVSTLIDEIRRTGKELDGLQVAN